MKCRLLDTAKAEVRDAAKYYNAQKRGLGREFRLEVKEAIKLI